MKYIGLDPITQLFSAPSINMASIRAFEELGKPWNYGAMWNTSSTATSDWLLSLASRMNVRYIVYRKETDDRFIQQTREKIQKYRSEKKISLVTANQWFELYTISPDLFSPQVAAPTDVWLSNVHLQSIPNLLDRLDTDTALLLSGQNMQKRIEMLKLNAATQFTPPTLEYKKINATTYVVRVHQATTPFFITLRESYHADWKARVSGYAPLPISTGVMKKIPMMTQSEDEWQASKQEVVEFIRNGFISTIGNGTEKQRSYLTWSNTFPVQSAPVSQSVEYISKSIHGSIQNENLRDARSRSAYQLSDYDHTVVDGYANGWYLQPHELCKHVACNTSPRGSSFEIVLEFRQQSVLDASLVLYTATIVSVVFGSAVYYFVRRYR